MRNRRAAFRQADIERALKGAKAAGAADVRLEIEPGTGKLTLAIGAAAKQGCGNSFDGLMED